MSTIPEALTATQCGMRVLALSMVTNVANPDEPETVDPEEVVTIARLGQQKLSAIVEEVVKSSREKGERE